MSTIVEPKFSGSNAIELLVPSSRMLRAALSGLLVIAPSACEDDGDAAEQRHDEQLGSKEVDALCKDMVDEAVDKAIADQDVKALCKDSVEETEALWTEKVEAAEKKAENAKPDDGDLPKLCEGMVDSARADLEKNVSDLKGEVKKLQDEITALKEKGRSVLLTTEEKTGNAEQKEYTFAQLTTMCDERGGYTQIHGACGGHNACAGFSYGDWGPGAAMFTEHTCSGVNGCTGLSCVVLPEDKGRSGKELYEDVEFPEPLGTCGGCHGGYYDDNAKWQHDVSRFAVYVFEGSNRTEENWLDRSVEEQERVTAFGARGLVAGAVSYQNMGAYHGVLSRAETKRVIEHIRTLKPFVHKIKTADKSPAEAE